MSEEPEKKNASFSDVGKIVMHSPALLATLLVGIGVVLFILYKSNKGNIIAPSDSSSGTDATSPAGHNTSPAGYYVHYEEISEPPPVINITNAPAPLPPAAIPGPPGPAGPQGPAGPKGKPGPKPKPLTEDDIDTWERKHRQQQQQQKNRQVKPKPPVVVQGPFPPQPKPIQPMPITVHPPHIRAS